jgi:hypothetical protein
MTNVLLGLLMLALLLVGHFLNVRRVSRKAQAMSAEIERTIDAEVERRLKSHTHPASADRPFTVSS